MSVVYKYKLDQKVTSHTWESQCVTFLRAAEQDSQFGHGMCCWFRLDPYLAHAPNSAVKQVVEVKIHLIMTGEEFEPGLTWLDTVMTRSGVVCHVMLEHVRGYVKPCRCLAGHCEKVDLDGAAIP